MSSGGTAGPSWRRSGSQVDPTYSLHPPTTSDECGSENFGQAPIGEVPMLPVGTATRRCLCVGCMGPRQGCDYGQKITCQPPSQSKIWNFLSSTILIFKVPSTFSSFERAISSNRKQNDACGRVSVQRPVAGRSFDLMRQAHNKLEI